MTSKIWLANEAIGINYGSDKVQGSLGPISLFLKLKIDALS
jgi:hypothetical protein